MKKKQNSFGFYILLGGLILIAIGAGLLRFMIIPAWNEKNDQILKQRQELDLAKAELEKFKNEEAMRWSDLPLLELSSIASDAAELSTESAEINSTGSATLSAKIKQELTGTASAKNKNSTATATTIQKNIN